MEIRIICLGKIKDNNLSILINNYLKKINHFHKCSIIELKEITFKEETETNIEKILNEESKLIEKYMEDSFNISLCVEAKQLDSLELANIINNHKINGSNYKYLNIIIGSSYGIHENIKQKSNLRLSISKMTFPHQLVRLIILEQLYRSFMIISNNKYHK